MFSRKEKCFWISPPALLVFSTPPFSSSPGDVTVCVKTLPLVQQKCRTIKSAGRSSWLPGARVQVLDGAQLSSMPSITASVRQCARKNVRWDLKVKGTFKAVRTRKKERERGLWVDRTGEELQHRCLRWRLHVRAVSTTAPLRLLRWPPHL